MTDITAPPAKLTRDFGTKADKNYKAILATQAQVAEGFLVMGSLLKACRDEKYYTAYGHEKFEHFLGSPELGMSRSMAFGLIQVHELYVLKLDRPQEELVKAGIGKLLTIAPVVEANPDEWMAKTAMSRSDLKLEVDEATGKEPKALVALSPDVVDEAKPLDAILPMDGDYVSWVRKQGCIICGKAAEPHHFPVTKGSGGAGVKDHVIPLCRECHTEAHDDPNGWMTTYKVKWGNYFFNVILMLWPRAEAKPVIDTTCVAVEEPKEELALPKPEKKTRKERKAARDEHKLIKSVSVGTIGSVTGIGLDPRTASMEVADGAAMPDIEEGLASIDAEHKELMDELSSDADKSAEELLKEAEPRVMEGFGKFAKCHTCGNVLPESELEGGLCSTCRG